MAARGAVRPLLRERAGAGVRLTDVRRLLLLLPLVLVACGGDDEPTTRQAARTTSTSTSTTTSTTSTTAAPEAELEDGRHFGFIEAVDDAGGVEIDFDLAQWFSGEEANRAAEEDGVIEPGEGVPNDYYVRNVNERVRTLPVAGDAAISVVRRECCESQALGSVEEWVRWYRESPPNMFGGRDSAWWVTVEAGTVVGIEEQYRP